VGEACSLDQAHEGKRTEREPARLCDLLVDGGQAYATIFKT